VYRDDDTDTDMQDDDQDSELVSTRPSAPHCGTKVASEMVASEIVVDLPSDYQVTVATHLAANLPDDTRVTTVCRIDLYAGAFRSLLAQPKPGNNNQHMWLDDSVINAYGQLVAAAYPGTTVLSTFFSQKLSNLGSVSGASAADLDATFAYASRADLLQPPKVAIPIHTGNHWVLATIDNAGRQLTFYDSLSCGVNGRQMLTQLRDFLFYVCRSHNRNESDVAAYKIASVVKKLPQQSNDYDCGAYVMAFVYCIARGVNLCFDSCDMPMFRKRVVYELLKNNILQ